MSEASSGMQSGSMNRLGVAPHVDRAHTNELSSSNWDEDDDEFYDAVEEVSPISAPIATFEPKPSDIANNDDIEEEASGSESSQIDLTSPSANIPKDIVDPVAQAAEEAAVNERRHQIYDLDTGEVIPIDHSSVGSDDIYDTFTNQPNSAAAVEESDPQESHRKRILTGLFSKIMHRTNPSEAAFSNNVKVKAHNKKEVELSALKLMQTISVHNGPIWSMKWSPCGSYLATAGQDATIRIWTVIGSDLPQEQHVDDEKASEPPHRGSFVMDEHSSVFDESLRGRTVLNPVPYRIFSGHKTDIIDLAWSKSLFLLSGSLDKTVRLWHVSRMQCLSSFQHADYVTAIAFHPTESRKFLSASFDKKLRMWDILDHRVVDWAQTPTMITSATFNPSGKLAVAGLYSGQVVFYQTEGLKYFTQIDCKNRHGKHKNGRKVTGLQFTHDGRQILISTNDSRVRLYDMDDYSMSMKYKGHVNETLLIRAHFSDDCQHIISGSDASEVFIWATNKGYQASVKGSLINRSRNSDRNDTYEYFKSHSGIVTVALLAPEKTILFGTRASPQGGPIRQLIVAAGYDGKMKLFENRADPAKI